MRKWEQTAPQRIERRLCAMLAYSSRSRNHSNRAFRERFAALLDIALFRSYVHMAVARKRFMISISSELETRYYRVSSAAVSRNHSTQVAFFSRKQHFSPNRKDQMNSGAVLVGSPSVMLHMVDFGMILKRLQMGSDLRRHLQIICQALFQYCR